MSLLRNLNRLAAMSSSCLYSIKSNMVCLLGELSILKLGLVHYWGTHKRSLVVDSLMFPPHWPCGITLGVAIWKSDPPKAG